jgi:small-conductance mechanosensitive channel
MPLVNRETGEPAPARNPQPTAREKLQDLNEQSKAELENNLLKESLTEYGELFAQYQKAQNDFHQQVERRLEEERQRNAEEARNLQEQVTALKNANELLSASISTSVAALTSSVRDATVQTVQDGLKSNKEALGSAVKKVMDSDKEITKTLREHLATFKEQEQRLFDFDSFRIGVFWAGCGCNILSLILLIWVIFFRG